MLDMVGNTNCWFSHAQAQLLLYIDKNLFLPWSFYPTLWSDMTGHVRDMIHPRHFVSQGTGCAYNIHTHCGMYCQLVI